MTRDELTTIILATFLAPYGDYATPALHRQFAICARQAAERILAAQDRRPPARVVKVNAPMKRAG